MQLDLASLQAVNTRVNTAVTYTDDMTKYHVADKWEDALDEGDQGDCEDYAIAKLRLLLAGGWPRADLKLGVCTTEMGDCHAVLVVTLDGEDWVLDNRTENIQRWEDAAYQWVRFYCFGEQQWRLTA